ncbi:nucleotidyl transferase AbiEii/AbiGii toxin family protein [Patescibacteria group bacterium]|nr:nucleotidyl transferase AbiEii/AbiGii toxin family protein [Patescibacteria group bacterium]
MISNIDFKKYSSSWGIDEYTVMREYIQLVFLGALYQTKNSEKVFFKGGTALRLIYNSMRFSEDLDFDSKLTYSDIKTLFEKSIKDIQNFLPGISLIIIENKYDNFKAKIRYEDNSLPYPLNIRIDVNTKEEWLEKNTSLLVSSIPIPYSSIIKVFSASEILVEKIRALIGRSKGRDLFDIWFLLGRGVEIDNRLLKKKMSLYAKDINLEEIRKVVLDFNDKKLKDDLNKFLPLKQRVIIPYLKESLIKLLDETKSIQT